MSDHTSPGSTSHVSDPAYSFLAGLAAEHREAERIKVRSQDVRGGGYEGGRVTRLNQHWQPSHRSADAAIGENASLLLARSRDLVRNEPVAEAAMSRIVENVIGPEGLDLDASARVGDDLDDEFNAEADAKFMAWCESEADASGHGSMADLQELMLREVGEGGEVLILEVADRTKGRTVPIAFQLLEAEQLDAGKDRPAGTQGNEIRRGVELDGAGRPVAYWIFDRHPNDYQLGKYADSVRVPAERVIHLFYRRRARQSRGVSWFATVIRTLKDLGWYTENELQASAIGALFAAVIKSDSGAGGQAMGLAPPDGAEETDDDGNYFEDLGPGIVARLKPGESIETVKSDRPNSGAEPWINLILQLVALGLGMSRLALLKDYRGINYSGARGNELADRKYWRRLQRWFARPLLEMRRRWLKQAVALGVVKSISPQQLQADPQRWMAATVQAPGWEWVDPVKEMEADREAIKARLLTFKDAFSRRGKDWRAEFRQMKVEGAYGEELELTMPTDPPPEAVAPAAPGAAPGAPAQPGKSAAKPASKPADKPKPAEDDEAEAEDMADLDSDADL